MHYTFNIERGNFTDAGQASSSVKRTLKQLGVDPANIKDAGGLVHGIPESP